MNYLLVFSFVIFLSKENILQNCTGKYPWFLGSVGYCTSDVHFLQMWLEVRLI